MHRWFVKTLFGASFVAVLTGCSSPYKSSQPDGYSGPLATVGDTALVQSRSLVHLFYLEQVADRRLDNSAQRTRMANAGKGLVITPETRGHAVPAEPTKLKITATTMHAAPILAMTGKSCHVTGEMDVRLEAGKTYFVKGKLSPQACMVWLETAAGAVVGQKFTAAGLK